jgi:hypothetical protein
VLNQTHENLEIIVVDDASPDDSASVVGGFGDRRIRYIRHDVNRGAYAARNTGIRAAESGIIAFLDQDDLFHPRKIEVHAALLNERADVGATYGPRYEMNHSSTTVADVWCPPDTLALADVVLGFPMSPSDMVVRREWLERAGLWDETNDFFGGEIILAGRLFFAGCRFVNVRQVLNYRRYHSGRIYADLATHCKGELTAQEKILSDPRCAADVVAQRDVAFANTYLMWSFIALKQGDFSLGTRYILEAVGLNGSLLGRHPCQLLEFLVGTSVTDIHEDHASTLARIMGHLPDQLAALRMHLTWAVARGHLIKGSRLALWNSIEEAAAHFSAARDLGGAFDEAFEGRLAYQLATYELACGAAAAEAAVDRLAFCLGRVGLSKAARRIRARYLVNKGFRNYRNGARPKVIRHVTKALATDPRYLLNRGVLSILGRSLLGAGIPKTESAGDAVRMAPSMHPPNEQ